MYDIAGQIVDIFILNVGYTHQSGISYYNEGLGLGLEVSAKLSIIK